MASVLKRKRGPVEVSDTLQRTKSLRSKNGKPLSRPDFQSTGWDAAFKPPTDLVLTNGVNGDVPETNGRLGSPESLNYEDIVKDSQTNGLEEEVPPKREESEEILEEVEIGASVFANSWKLSHSIGGRMIKADPVFTPDERFLITAKRATVEVYATANSLLTRSIALNLGFNTQAKIITLCLSPTNHNLAWVACSDGKVFCINWTTGAGTESSWTISSSGCIHMTVASMESAGRRRDVVFTTEKNKTGFRITANELYGPEDPIKTSARTIYTSQNRINFLKSAQDGVVLIGASGANVLVGRLRSNDYGTIDKIKYEFRSFESKDIVKSMDIRITRRTITKEQKQKKSTLGRTPIVDLILGDVRGSIFVHSDIAGKLFALKEGAPPESSLVPRKLHWHRQAVETVKWSLDGNYIISGGIECVLVLWQLDTGKHQFLPYLAAAIQNVVVAPSGISYAVKLADNSAMILSTADLEPKMHIAGIQTPAVQTDEILEDDVLRFEGAIWSDPLIQRTAAAISPAAPSRLLVAVGQSQEVRLSNPLVNSNPYLQTFDLATSRSLSSQALTRTNITNVNVAPTAHRLTEPRVLHMKLSYDGEWLATVDEWTPTTRDLEHLEYQGLHGSNEQQYRREVHLKFWHWDSESNIWELVSRTNAPHLLEGTSVGAGRVLDLAADPSSLQFATVGSDGVVRTWGTKSRKRDGVLVKGKDNNVLRNWHCMHEVSLGKPELDDERKWLSPAATGCVAFAEDGSTLAATCSSQDGLLHFLDPQNGTIRLSQTGLVEGEIFGMEFLGPELIVVSDRLIVFDVVADATKIDFRLQKQTRDLSIDQKREMTHLAVNIPSKTFALALPKSRRIARFGGNLSHLCSELIVFHQGDQELQVKEVFTELITALIPAVGSEGYLVLDAAAEVHTVMKKGSQAITTLAQSTSALQLDTIDDEPVKQLMDLVETEEEEEISLPTPEGTQDGNQEDDDDEHPVVTQQQLSEVFDIGPAFALPPMEEMFYQIAGLLSSKPLPLRV